MDEVARTPTAPLVVRAMRGEPVERTPVWAMRQAGRWDPEFRRLRQGRDFYAFSGDAELAAAASLCPLRFGVDAVILFYDITTLALAMGQEFDLVADRGPTPRQPIRSRRDVENLLREPDPSRYAAVLEMLELVRRALPLQTALLVFAGAPFTLATYQIGTGKDLDATRRFIAEQPTVWQALLEKTAEATVAFLRHLLACGAHAYQLFDSWAGGLDAEEYDRFAHPYHRSIFREVGGASILFVKDGPYLEKMVGSGAKMVSLGKVHNLKACREAYPATAFQGNVDHELLIDGTAEAVTAATTRCLAEGGGRWHVLNLDHGMDRRAKPENFQAFVNAARIR